jgi:hypothetical protein
MNYESYHANIPRLHLGIVIGSVTFSLFACETAVISDTLAVAQHDPAQNISQQVSAAVNLVQNYQGGNTYESCSATKVGPNTYLTAQHCWNLSTDYYAAVTVPYNILEANIPLPSYHLTDVNKLEFADGLAAIVKNPAGEDVSVFTLKRGDTPAISEARLAEENNLNHGEHLQVTGFPARLKGSSASFDVQYQGNITIVENSQQHHISPAKYNAEYQAYVLPEGTPDTIAKDFCEGGGMSGSSFINDHNQIEGVLSTVIPVDDINWKNAAEILKLRYKTQICLAAPITASLVANYQNSEQYVPVASELAPLGK